MNDLKDFNDTTHRVQSASIVFQRGLFHTYMLQNRPHPDAYSRSQRLNQSAHLLGLVHLLLDTDFRITDEHLHRLCPSLRHELKGKYPSRTYIDPAAVVKRSEVGAGKYCLETHPLAESRDRVVKVVREVGPLRDELEYRPMLLQNSKGDRFLRDCPLVEDLKGISETPALDSAYRDFFSTMIRWAKDEGRPDCALPLFFVRQVYSEYPGGGRPAETALVAYARVLMNPGDHRLLADVSEFRNRLLNLKTLLEVPGIFPAGLFDRTQLGMR